MNFDNRQEEDSSLFGSPPPSPYRGRSPSLALPGADENVGTLALPGSQYISESPVIHTAPVNIPLKNFEPRSLPSSSRLNPRQKDKRKSIKSRKRSNISYCPSPVPLLYDPEKPVPPNFLRNQQALLGLAGLVGGVKLSDFAKSNPGSSADNPIVIKDNHILLDKQHESVFNTPSQLPVPSNEEIVAYLINQGSIFPVLRSLLSILRSDKSFNPQFSNDGQSSTYFSAYSGSSVSNVEFARGENRDPKRRKLIHGQEYSTGSDSLNEGLLEQSSKRQRGKELVARLARLVNEAAREVALKKHLQEQYNGAQDNLSPTERFASVDYSASSYSKLSNLSFFSKEYVPHVLELPSDSPMPSTPIDEPFANFDSFNSLKPDPLSWPDMDIFGDGFQQDDTASEHLQSDLEKWLANLNSTPLDQDIFSFSVTGLEMADNGQPVMDTSSSHTASHSDGEAPMMFSDIDMAKASSSSEFDINCMIDPILLQASEEARFQQSNPGVPSVSDQNTGDGFFPEMPERPLYVDGELNKQTVPVSSVGCSSILPTGGDLSNANRPFSEIGDSVTSTGPSCTMPYSNVPVESEAMQRTTVPPIISTKKSILSNHASTAEILEHAKAVREQLSDELTRVKVQLWEMTMEQGLLIYLTKDKTL